MLNNTKQSIIGKSLEILPSVDSSNNYAMQQIHDGKAVHGNAYLALEQTQGKGQRGKTWHTGAGRNLALSIVLEPKHLKIDNQFLLTAFVSVVVLEYLQIWDKNFKIKWPNDLYCYDRKAAGILIENSIRGVDWKYSVVGIGLNINEEQFADYVQNGISLKQISGKEQDLIEIASTLLNMMEQQWILFCNQPDIFLDKYNDNLYKKNELVHFKKDGEPFSATILEVSADGRLHCHDKEKHGFDFGTIEWLLT